MRITAEQCDEVIAAVQRIRDDLPVPSPTRISRPAPRPLRGA